jgi:uncharacterized protein (DUF927 family)
MPNTEPTKIKLAGGAYYQEYADGTVFYFHRNRKKRVESGVFVDALVRDEGDDVFRVRVHYPSIDGSRGQLIVRRSQLSKIEALKDELLDAGLKVHCGDETLLVELEALEDRIPRQQIRRVSGSGWHGSEEDGFCFVLGRLAVHEQGQRLRYESLQAEQGFLRRSGTSEWRESVGEKCCGNPLLMFAVCCGFAAPLAQLAKIDTGSVHIYGQSSTGKTILAEVVCSIFGDPTKYLMTWNGTKNAPEVLGVMYKDLP